MDSSNKSRRSLIDYQRTLDSLMTAYIDKHSEQPLNTQKIDLCTQLINEKLIPLLINITNELRKEF